MICPLCGWDEHCGCSKDILMKEINQLKRESDNDHDDYLSDINDMMDQRDNMKAGREKYRLEIKELNKQLEILRKVNKMRWEEMSKMKEEIEHLKEEGRKAAEMYD